MLQYSTSEAFLLETLAQALVATSDSVSEVFDHFVSPWASGYRGTGTLDFMATDFSVAKALVARAIIFCVSTKLVRVPMIHMPWLCYPIMKKALHGI